MKVAEMCIHFGKGTVKFFYEEQKLLFTWSGYCIFIGYHLESKEWLPTSNNTNDFIYLSELTDKSFYVYKVTQTV